MNAQLKALFTGLGVLTVGGVGYYFVSPKPGVTRADLIAAGVNSFCVPVHLECAVRNHCRMSPPLADGGPRPRYGTLETKGYSCDRDGGNDVLIVRMPRMADGGECYEPIGDDACRLLEAEGTCTDNAVCDDSSGPTAKAAQDRCACRASSGACRTPNPDGGTGLMIPLGVTVQAPFAGAGCVRKSCLEVSGEQGQSWPSECPP